ncbi:cation:proton antiporter [Nanoarchaeota archaeon]
MDNTHLIVGELLLKLAIILASAKVARIICHKIDQPAVLGELVVGALLGPSLLNVIIPGQSEVLTFLAEIGVILLLFQVGLESNIYQLLKVGLSSSLVALIGIIAPFGLGYLYFAYVNGASSLISLYVAATLTATSVGVTMRVLSEIKKLNSDEGKIILGAAVIDDIIGLIILSVLVGITELGRVSLLNIGKISFYSITFLVLTAYLGIKFAPKVQNAMHKLVTQRTFIVPAFIFAIFCAYLANLIGLATIVGAFAAGLVLETTKEKKEIEKRLKPVADLFVPVFFVMAGAYFNWKALLEPGIIPVIIILSIIAVVSKIVSGLGVVRTKASRLAVGVGMIPRGEVGLIFATYGLTNGIVSASLYSALVLVIMITTIIPPPILKRIMHAKTQVEPHTFVD